MLSRPVHVQACFLILHASLLTAFWPPFWLLCIPDQFKIQPTSFQSGCWNPAVTYIHIWHMYFIALFSPHAQTKNEKERGEPGKIWSVRTSKVERTWLHVGEQVNLPMLYWQNTHVQSWKLYGWQNGTRQHYITLPGSTARCGERTQTRTFENHTNLLAYLTNWALYTPGNGFRGVMKLQGSPFLTFAQAFSALIVQRNGVPVKHDYMYCRLCHYGHGHIDDPPTLN